MKQTTMDHEYLRQRAMRWLAKTKHCGVVLSEIATHAQEIPDAIGWYGGRSYLVECKISRGDFRANQFKSHVSGNYGVGDFKYFLVPAGLVSAEDLPQGWGLLYCDPERIRVICDSAFFSDRNETLALRNEITMLVSALRRVKTRQFLTIMPPEHFDDHAEAAA
jgi:hypothetical protein